MQSFGMAVDLPGKELLSVRLPGQVHAHLFGQNKHCGAGRDGKLEYPRGVGHDHDPS